LGVAKAQELGAERAGQQEASELGREFKCLIERNVIQPYTGVETAVDKIV